MQHTSVKSAHLAQFNVSCFVSLDYIREMQRDLERLMVRKQLCLSAAVEKE